MIARDGGILGPGSFASDADGGFEFFFEGLALSVGDEEFCNDLVSELWVERGFWGWLVFGCCGGFGLVCLMRYHRSAQNLAYWCRQFTRKKCVKANSMWNHIRYLLQTSGVLNQRGTSIVLTCMSPSSIMLSSSAAATAAELAAGAGGFASSLREVFSTLSTRFIFIDNREKK